MNKRKRKPQPQPQPKAQRRAMTPQGMIRGAIANGYTRLPHAKNELARFQTAGNELLIVTRYSSFFGTPAQAKQHGYVNVEGN